MRKIVLGYKASSDEYISYLRKKGILIGDNVRIFSPNHTIIDDLHPHMLSIGNNVNMTGPVTILCHDYSTIACQGIGGYFGNVKSVTIGNNVFLGWGATILPGTTIEDNVIVGAGAVVTGRLMGESVYAGNPARLIMIMEEYLDKRENSQIKEAVDIYRNYYDRFAKKPSVDVFGNYKYLFIENTKHDHKKHIFSTYEEFQDYLNKQK